MEVFATIGENWLWSSDVDWLSSGEALSQTGSKTFTYAFSANESGESRVGTLTFFSSQGGATATLQVTQLSGSTLSLELSTTEQVVLSPADSKDIGIVSNTEWTWISDAAWLSSAEDLTQTNDQTFTYSVVENNTAEDRVGSITFFSTSGGIIRTLTVTQLRGVGNFLILSDEQLLTDFTAKDPLTVEVISNTNWLWESSDSWLTAGTEDLTQNGTQTLTYEVAENTTGATRTATLTFRTEANDVQVTLTVTQLSGTGTTLNLSETTLVTDFTGKTTLNVGVSSNTTWVWQSSDPTWFTAGTEGLTQINDQPFEYEVAQNTTGTNRTATLTFTSQAGDVTAVLEVTQLSGAGLTLNLSETARVTGAAANAALTVDVSSNTDWLWSSDADWLTSGELQEQSNDVARFTYAVEENATTEERSGTITFTSATGGLIATLDVTQLAGSGLTLSLADTQQANSPAAQTRTVNVFSNTDWAWVSDSEWLTAGTELIDQDGDQTFTYEVDENQTGATRTGTLTFATATGGITTTLEVTQLGGSVDGFFITLSDTQQATGAQADVRSFEVFSNTDWTWSVENESEAGFITSGEALSQNGDQNFTYQVAEFTGAENANTARTGVIVFRSLSGELIATLTVTQGTRFGNYIILADSTQASSFSAQDVTVDVFSNTDWRWESDSDWLTSAEDLDQNGDQLFTYQLSVNDTGASRTGNLTFTTAAGNITAVLEVTQLSGTTVSLSLSDTQQANPFDELTRDV